MKKIDKRYNPNEYEEKWADFWVDNKTFNSNPDNSRDPYSIVIPPPNVTGILHMGHALNNVLQDIIIRVNKIINKNVMWQPGTDHGGIATQNVVERKLLAEGKSREDLGREKFLKRMWEWRYESGDTIINQLKRLGCGCAWDRLRFTMDEQCSKAVMEAFICLYEKGMIYRGSYLINWCPRCGTALSDIEVEHSEKKGKLWYIKYPVKGEKGKNIIVATTRPETMLGDTAVAVNPKDKRFKDLIGKKIVLPVIGREMEIIADEFVDPGFGTGMVKVTPAHDPNDFEMGKKHGLEFVKVIDEQGLMTEDAGEFKGQERFECRKNLVEKLEKEGLIEKIEDYDLSVGECYRCATIIEPLLSKQWFVKMKDLAAKAIKASEEKKVVFVPESWEKAYLHWLENLHNWCISRQIWWGHRIPVYYCEEGDCDPMVAREKPDKCPKCGSGNIRQDEDVLDTWFSSALWPFSTLRWPEKTEDLNYYFPTDVLVTGHEILYLWVARMVMMSLEFMGDIPFRNVYIHGMIRDKQGKKMSKSMGNIIDPLDIIKKFGTDSLRFALAKCAVPGRDMQLSEDDFIGARNFCNKIWNATRLILNDLEISEFREPDINELELADKWILFQTEKFIDEIKEEYLRFNNANAARLIYEFTWKYFCDWYLELAKLRLYSNNKEEKIKVETVLVNILVKILNIIHPIMPFISSQLWEYLAQEVSLPADNPLYFNGFDTKHSINFSQVEKMDMIMNIVSGIRNIRGEMGVQPSLKLSVKIKANQEGKKLIEEYSNYIRLLGGLENIEIGAKVSKGSSDAVVVAGDISVYVGLPGDLVEKELARLGKRIQEVKDQIEFSNRKLRNRDFIEKAPEEVVGKVKSKLEEYEKELQKLEKSLKQMNK
ncbi:valine--tRNA ligase [Elusimicrobiota bacterium]